MEEGMGGHMEEGKVGVGGGLMEEVGGDIMEE